MIPTRNPTISDTQCKPHLFQQVTHDVQKRSYDSIHKPGIYVKLMYCAIPSISPVAVFDPSCATRRLSPTPTQPLPLRASRVSSGLRGVGASDGTEAGVSLVEDLESGTVSVV